MWVVEQVLEQLKLAVCERHLLSPMANHSSVRIEPQPVQIPKPLVPKSETRLIPLLLPLNDLQIFRDRLLSDRRKACSIPLHALDETSLEFKEIGIDPDPVASIFPVGRL